MRQRRALGLNLVLGALKARRHRRRRKLDPGHTRRGEQRLRLRTALRQLVLKQRRSVAGMITGMVSTPPRISHPSGPSRTTCCRMSSSTTATKNRGFPWVR